MLQSKPSARMTLFAILFLISGAAGLIYEIIWERLLEVYFGVTITAVTLIVSAYMAGLGSGAILGGQVARKVKNLLLAYGLVEIGIAMFGLVSLPLLQGVGKITAGSPYSLVFLLSFALLLLPTMLMGMTLPLLSQAFVDRLEHAGNTIGLLYGLNTLGAAFGALISGYILIGEIGFEGTTHFAVFLNLSVGICAILLQRGRQTPSLFESIPSIPSTNHWPYTYILFASFLVGFIDLGFEMLWFRLLGVLNKNTAYAFPTILGIFLIGLAVGGILWGRRADRSPDPIRLFWQLQIGVGLIASLSFLVLWAAIHMPSAETWLQSTFNNFQQPFSPYIVTKHSATLSLGLIVKGMFVYLVPVLMIVLPASMFMGGGLPVLDRIAITNTQITGKQVGEIYLANILGSVIGSLTISFLLLPSLGTELIYKFLGLTSLIFPILYLMKHPARFARKDFALPIGLLLVIIFLPWRGQLYTDIYQTVTNQPAVVHESKDTVLTLNLDGNRKNASILWISGVQNSYFPSDGRYERSALTCAGASKPKRILVIGLGGGNTAYFLGNIDGIEELLVVEIIHDLAPFLTEYVPTTRSLMSNPKLAYVVDDGRRFLYGHADEKFDLIFIDPLYSFTSGHNNLYSQEAMELYKSHLTESGIFCGWINEEHILPLTVAHVFPYTDLFREYIVASNSPLVYDVEYMESIARKFLSTHRSFITTNAEETLNLKKIFSRKLGDRSYILAREKGVPILTDLTPWLEYYYFNAPVQH